MDVQKTLAAMKATMIPARESGLWVIRDWTFRARDCQMIKRVNGRIVRPGLHKFLRRYTDSTLHEDGEIVMEDTEHELKKHLAFILKAYGRVLVTGLGLGCVARGLLANPNVTALDVVEVSDDVLKLVQPFMPRDQRLAIHHRDAFEFVDELSKGSDPFYDVVWHDIWTDVDDGQPNLSIAHADLMYRSRNVGRRQDAWEFPRDIRRVLANAGIRRAVV